jgi:DNA replication protein DnaC
VELRHQLTPHLTKLRLSGILQTLEARDRQAVDGHWSYIEFLARLLEDEVERRAQKQLALRLRRATVNSTKTLETFDFTHPSQLRGFMKLSRIDGVSASAVSSPYEQTH